MWAVDTLVNFLSRLGTSSDKATQHRYIFKSFDKPELDAAYRSDWIARKAVDIPVADMTREWRSWQADQTDITAIEKVERAMKVQLRTKQALIKARLYGGGAIIMGLDDSAGPQDQELDLKRVRKDSLKFLHAVTRYDINPGPLEEDLLSPLYGEPQYYERSSPTKGIVRIHPSRVIKFIGNDLPDATLKEAGGWGDSVLMAVDDAMRTASASLANVAALVEEAKFDIIKLPEMMKNFATKEYEDRLTKRFTYSNNAKGIINALLLDKNEEWSRVTQNFAGLPDIVKLYLLVTCGAVDVPATRFLGQSAIGLGATGEGDIRNYYDRLASDQNTGMTPTLEPLDEVVIRSATGARDDTIFFEWNPLWQMTEKEKAETAKSKADTFKVDNDAGLINPDALRDGRINQLIEDGVYPGFEQSIEDFGDVPPEPVGNFDPTTGAPLGPDGKPLPPAVAAAHAAASAGPVAKAAANENALFGAQKKRANDALYGKRRKIPLKGRTQRQKELGLVADARPRTLYLRRDVLNAAAIHAHYEAQGVAGLKDAASYHVTIAYSKTEVDWMQIGSDSWGSDEAGRLRVAPGGVRLHEPFGVANVDQVMALLFTSSNLSWRHSETDRAGCVWKWDDYQPHITIADAGTMTTAQMDDIEPWTGAIELGPEIFEEIDPARIA